MNKKQHKHHSNGDRRHKDNKLAPGTDFYNYEIVDDNDISSKFGNFYNDEISKELDLTRFADINPKVMLRDYGPNPLVINIEEAAEENNVFRRALWTGSHLQVTLMSIPPGGEVGLEIHPDIDQFIRIEDGRAVVKMGKSRDKLDYNANAKSDYAILIPAGMWHNIINAGGHPLKLYSIYAPPHHPKGTVQITKSDADAAKY